MDTISAAKSAEEQPPSYDRHLLESTPIVSSSLHPPNLWRSSSETASLPGPSSAVSAPAADIKKQLRPDEALPESIPPVYTRQDPHDRFFAFQAPLILSAPSESGPLVPRFHMTQLRSSTDKPYKLHLRRLTTNESRRLSMPKKKAKIIDYDYDLTLYLILNDHALFPWASPEIAIRGCKARTLQGYVELKKTATSYQFWHITRNLANDMLKPENERKMIKYGYRADDELTRKLLFAAEQVELLSKDKKWKDDKGLCVAMETKGTLNLTADLDAQKKDALLACWVARCWLVGTLNW
ncbi:hypothetical protein EsH8_II_000343 [Colletotrichum jinshuiense]